MSSNMIREEERAEELSCVRNTPVTVWWSCKKTEEALSAEITVEPLLRIKHNTLRSLIIKPSESPTKS